VFNEARLLSRAGRLPIQGGAYCSVCGEWYEGEGAIVLAALGRLRDLLDDLDHARLRREGAQDAGGAG
jgi:hypothetical protein